MESRDRWNEQFSHPLSDDRIRAIDAGEIEPMVFDSRGVG
jgi:hypothetical protein